MTTKTLPDLGDSFEVTADITKRDIKHGVKSDCLKCPAAVAFGRELGKLGFGWAEVTGSMVFAGAGDPDTDDVYYGTYSLVEELGEFTHAFDTNKNPGPTRITVTLGLHGPSSYFDD